MSTIATIFLLDDEREFVRNTAKLLRLTLPHIKVQGFCNKQQLYTALEECAPSVLLLDILMPDCDGEEILIDLKARNMSSAVIMITAENDLQRAVRCIKAGAVDYLTKPVITSELLGGIEQYLPENRPVTDVPYERCRTLKEWYSTLFQSPPESDAIIEPLFRKMESYVAEQGYLQPGQTVSSVAKSFHTNSRYFSKLINSVWGISFSEFLARLRVVYFMQLAIHQKQQEFSLDGVASNLGFASRTSFYTSVKKHIGLTPSQCYKATSDDFPFAE